MLKNFLSAENKKRKSYVLDTSVLVYHGEAIHNFPDSNIYIPLEVLEELDNLKTRMDKVGANGRYVNKYLDKLRKEGSLIDGVEIENNMIIYIAAFSDITLLPLSMSDTVDNKIISCGLVLAKEEHDVTVVSRDISLRVRCDALDIDAIDYDKELHLKRDFFNDGIITIKTTTDVIDQFHQTGVIDLDDYEQYELLPNQGVMLKCGQSSALGLAVDDRTIKRLNYASGKGFEMEGIVPRSAEQSIAAELLMDPDIHLVTMTGMAGSGKTLLSIAAALKQIQAKRYKKIMLARPAESTSAALGFMPGPLTLDSKIYTPNGFTLMKDIKVNDEVIAHDGTVTKVDGVYPAGLKDVYRVTLDNKTHVDCCEDHPWLTFDNNKYNTNGNIKNTKEIIEDIYVNKKSVYLPRNGVVQYSKKELPLAPYTLGALIGDGSFGGFKEKIYICGKDIEIIDRVNKEVADIGCYVSYSKRENYLSNNIFNDYKSKYRNRSNFVIPTKVTNIINNTFETLNTTMEVTDKYNITRSQLDTLIKRKIPYNEFKFEKLKKEFKFNNRLKDIIHSLGLIDTVSTTKYIPEIYKYSSKEDRLALLQGLMDTDGTIKKNGETSFCTTSLRLANDVVELVRSLGGDSKIRKFRDRSFRKVVINNYSVKNINKSYEFNIKLPSGLNPFYLKRKAERCKEHSILKNKKIISIEKLDERQLVQCIRIEHKDHLFLTNDFIVTHNTKDEKLEPWLQPFFDNLEVILGSNIKNNPYFQKLMEKGIIEMEAISFIRGRTLPNTIFIIDEAQNISHHEAKALLTRMGENSKIVLIGDLEQIDSKHLDEKTSGLASVVDLFKEFEHSGHIRLRKGERSKLATYAAKVM